ncbi:hypothetical protein BH11PLA1_BH11PLA1_08270 [soil metagenome]
MVFTRGRLVSAASLLACAGMLALGGCYKAEADTQKARADKAEADLAAATTRMTDLNKQAEGMRIPAMKFQQMANGARLGVYVNNAKVGTDELKWDETRGEFVRSGARVRSTSNVRFENGRLADQIMRVGRESGKPLVEGQVKNSRPDGDWIWYDTEGRPAFKETWKDGKLDALYSGSVSKAATKPATTSTKKPTAGAKTPAKPGTTAPAGTGATPPPAGTTAVPAGPNTLPTGEIVTWKAMSKAERDERVRRTAATFAALPELIRE